MTNMFDVQPSTMTSGELFKHLNNKEPINLDDEEEDDECTKWVNMKMAEYDDLDDDDLDDDDLDDDDEFYIPDDFDEFGPIMI